MTVRLPFSSNDEIPTEVRKSEKLKGIALGMLDIGHSLRPEYKKPRRGKGLVRLETHLFLPSTDQGPLS